MLWRQRVRKHRSNTYIKIEDQAQTAAEVINSSQMAEDNEMFTFDHLSGISQTDMEQVVRGVQTDLSLDVLAKSLKLADQAAADKFRGAMGMNVQKELNEIITTTPPMRVKDVEDEQQKIINLVKQMEAEGQITISQSGEEEELV